MNDKFKNLVETLKTFWPIFAMLGLLYVTIMRDVPSLVKKVAELEPVVEAHTVKITVMEESVRSIHEDIHDIKTMLIRDRSRRGSGVNE